MSDHHFKAVNPTAAGFPATRWTQIRQMNGADTRQRDAIISSLAEKYWRPVYAFIRRQGYSADIAMDYAQGFFLYIVLQRDLFSKADQSKGRFRTFIIAALKRYIIDEFKRNNASMRRPRGALLSIDDPDRSMPSFPAGTSPEDAFIYVWASGLLDETHRSLQEWYSQSGQEHYWFIFDDAVIQPKVKGDKRPTNRELCEKYGVATEVQLANVLTTVKRKYDSCLRQTIRPYVASDADVDDEINELFIIFSTMRA